ncbi:MAG: PepSY domain-containing protein [Gammaproteobacteria bacterium]|nr:PepSY domain-containing protein [Gammaproteobacteria bacterium]MCG3146280.1 hypothetical protein [Gammaproteobacteria bacterium]
MRASISVAAATVLAALVIGTPAAEDRPEREQDRAKRLVQEGKVLPLEAILARASTKTPGRLIEAELDEENGRYVYELEFADPATGRVTELVYDARSGNLLATEIDD